MDTRMSLQPRPDFQMFVGAEIVQDHVNDVYRRDVALNLVRELAAFLMAIASHVSPNYLASQHVKRCQ